MNPIHKNPNFRIAKIELLREFTKITVKKIKSMLFANPALFRVIFNI